MAEKVLLVDDEEEFTEVLAERMAVRGIKVDVAANGADAITLVQGASYDAVILDMMMPGLDGIETLKLMLEENPNLQVILLTGHATLQKGIEAMKIGAMEFMEKPVDIDKLIAIIQEARTKREALDFETMEQSIQDIMKNKGW